MSIPLLRIGAVCATVLASLISSCHSSMADDATDSVGIRSESGATASGAISLSSEGVTPPAERSAGRIFSSGPITPVSAQVTLPETAPMELNSAPMTAMQSVPVSPSQSTMESQYFEQPVYQPYVGHTCSHEASTRRWLSFESLLWWTSGADVPVLATTSPLGTPGNVAGVLAPGNDTQVLFGGGELFDFAQGGFRVRGGRWLNNCDGSGLTAEFLMLAPRGNNFYSESNGDLILARPFFNVGATPQQQDSELVAFPGLSNGRFRVSSNTNMYSVGLHYTQEIFDHSCDDCGCGQCLDSGLCGEGCGQGCEEENCQLGISIGPRFMHLNDTITMDETFTGVASGNQFRLRDYFDSQNSFLGGEFGVRARAYRGDFNVDLGLQLGIGATYQELEIAGRNSTTTATGTVNAPGGFFAQESNIGRYDRTRFSLIPALEAALGWELQNGWRFTAAYNLVFWTNVLRASEQIDTRINEDFFAPPITPSTGEARPSVRWHETDYIAHGISIGFERRW